jgi:hypothetical protein
MPRRARAPIRGKISTSRAPRAASRTNTVARSSTRSRSSAHNNEKNTARKASSDEFSVVTSGPMNSSQPAFRNARASFSWPEKQPLDISVRRGPVLDVSTSAG